MTDARRAKVWNSACEALEEIEAAVRCSLIDTVWSDEQAKDHLALAGLAIERFRRLLEAPVEAAERQHESAGDTVPASPEVAA